MKEKNVRSMNTPENEFLDKKQELFNLYLKMPVQFKKDYELFRKIVRKQGLEHEDVLGNLIIQFTKGEISFKKNLNPDEPKKE
jgi:DNA polymerase III delta prime subunit